MTDPISELRRANPVDVSRLPTEDARARALFEEVIMGNDMSPGPRRGRAWVWAVGLAVPAVAAVLALAVLQGPAPEEGAPTATDPVATAPTEPTSGGGPTLGSCVAFYSLETLADRETAFAGTVLSVEGAAVTFSVDEWFRGSGEPQVTLEASGGELTSVGGPSFIVGEKYLVAGDGGFAWACGFSQPYDPSIASQWAATFGD